MAQSSRTQPLALREKGERPWMTLLFALFYLALLAALVFLPGGSLLDRLRWLDSGICAQMPSHSFFPGGQELPLCSRNTGIYLGFIVTLVTLFATGRGKSAKASSLVNHCGAALWCAGNGHRWPEFIGH